MNFKKLLTYELNNNDINKILGKINIIKYPDLAKYNDINKCFGNKNAFVIFFETQNKNVGHWQCMFKQNNNLFFWDSYGLAPGTEINYISKQIAIQLKEYKPVLLDLLNKAVSNGQNVYYNNTDYQQWKGDVSTCGRHICTRILNDKMTEQQYYNYLTNYMRQNKLPTLDDAVTDITYKILGK